MLERRLDLGRDHDPEEWRSLPLVGMVLVDDAHQALFRLLNCIQHGAEGSEGHGLRTGTDVRLVQHGAGKSSSI